MPRILALTIRPVDGPDTRYRFQQYIEPLAGVSIHVDLHPLFSPAYYRSLGLLGGRPVKALGLATAFLRRLLDIGRNARAYDGIWLGRELLPLGAPLLEKLLLRLNQHVILDIDDAIFLPDPMKHGFIHKHLRDFDKLRRLAPCFSAVVCGNEFLAGYFRQWNAPKVHVLPTVVPFAHYRCIARSPSPVPRIGWIGTPTNAEHLEILRVPLAVLAARMDFVFHVVGLPLVLGWDTPRPIHFQWSLDRELNYFADFDIGVMPLADSQFTRGKCAFKLIQFMAAGIPVVASPVGANLDVVTHGQNGYFANTPEEWTDALARLVGDPKLRREMGERGRETIRQRFSLENHWQRYAQIIRESL